MKKLMSALIDLLKSLKAKADMETLDKRAETVRRIAYDAVAEVEEYNAMLRKNGKPTLGHDNKRKMAYEHMAVYLPGITESEARKFTDSILAKINAGAMGGTKV